MVMLTLLNAQERTEAEFRELFRQVDEGFVFKVSSLSLSLPSPDLSLRAANSSSISLLGPLLVKRET